MSFAAPIPISIPAWSRALDIGHPSMLFKRASNVSSVSVITGMDPTDVNPKNVSGVLFLFVLLFRGIGRGVDGRKGGKGEGREGGGEVCRRRVEDKAINKANQPNSCCFFHFSFPSILLILRLPSPSPSSSSNWSSSSLLPLVSRGYSNSFVNLV